MAFNNYLYQSFGYGAGYVLENIVYLELARKGFNIYVGSVKNKEVDFVAIKGDRIVYVQSAYMLIDKQIIEREYAALEAIDDSYEKIVVSMDDITLPIRRGIKHIQVWNLNEIK